MRETDLPVAWQVSQRLLSLPLYPKMTRADVNDVIRAVRKIASAHQVSTRPMAKAAARAAGQ
jgi:dTDP-4-amino-4,6-dideoxygalactose transaminase